MSPSGIVKLILSALALVFVGLPLFLSGLGCTLFLGFSSLQEMFRNGLGEGLGTVLSTSLLLIISVPTMVGGFFMVRALGRKIVSLFKKSEND